MNLPATARLVALLLPLATPAAAQSGWRLGVRGGALRATTSLDPATNLNNLPAYSYSARKLARLGWQAGLVLEVPLGRFALQPALLFAQKSYYSESSFYQGDFVGYSGFDNRTTRTNWLELPVHVVYTWHGAQIFAGPYVALAVGGQARGEAAGYGPTSYSAPYSYEYPLTYGPDADSRRLDAGLDAGLGYRLGALQVQLSYQLGLRNLHQPVGYWQQFISPYQGSSSTDAAYSRGWQLTGTYFFVKSSK